MPKDLYMKDVSSRAAGELEYALTRERRQQSAAVPTVSVEEAMTHERVYHVQTKRDVTRVLFVSTDTQLLNPTQQTLDGYIDIRDLFEEVHILILRTGIAPKNPVLRVADNVWLYTAAAKYWWQTPFAGIALAQEQLSFASGFRPDLIVARDPFESALVALNIAKRFNRPCQLHVLDDYTSPAFLKVNPSNFWRRFLTWHTMKQFDSVRTATHNLKRVVGKRVAIADLKTLPRFQNYDALLRAQPLVDVREKFHNFSVILLYIGELTYDSALWQVIDAASFALRNPRVGLIVIGKGVAKNEFEKRAKVQGVEQQVVFLSKVEDVVSYLKAATMLIVPDVDSASEEVVLKGAAAGVPLIIAETEKRSDVFTHAESAYLYEPGNVQALTDRINDLLNNIPLRQEFIDRAQALIASEFHQDSLAYQEEYRLSIEQALFVTEQDMTPSEVSPSP